MRDGGSAGGISFLPGPAAFSHRTSPPGHVKICSDLQEVKPIPLRIPADGQQELCSPPSAAGCAALPVQGHRPSHPSGPPTAPDTSSSHSPGAPTCPEGSQGHSWCSWVPLGAWHGRCWGRCCGRGDAVAAALAGLGLGSGVQRSLQSVGRLQALLGSCRQEGKCGTDTGFIQLHHLLCFHHHPPATKP